MLLVYKGDEIKVYVGGVAFKRDRPREVHMGRLSEAAKSAIESHPDIREAAEKDVASAKSDADLVIETPDYEPPPGHEIPTRRTIKKASKKKRGKR